MRKSRLLWLSALGALVFGVSLAAVGISPDSQFPIEAWSDPRCQNSCVGHYFFRSVACLDPGVMATVDVSAGSNRACVLCPQFGG